METRTSARDLFDAVYGLRTFLVDYEEALIQAALALLTRNHMFLVGPTGQGKSTFLTLLSELFDGASIFRPQLSAFTIPDHLIGPPIPSVYRREGKQLYYIDGGICDAQIALLEEFPDAGVALARALNTILLERKFITKDASYNVKLHSAFMTGNNVPHGEQWEAVRARQLFFFQAPRLRSISGRFSGKAKRGTRSICWFQARSEWPPTRPASGSSWPALGPASISARWPWSPERRGRRRSSPRATWSSSSCGPRRSPR